MNISAQQIIDTMFKPDEMVCLRVFEDKKQGIFKGQKLDVQAGKFQSVVEVLKNHNAQNRGIFFTVNYGGQEDSEIKRINAQYVEMDDKSFDEQMKLIEAFPLQPSLIIRTRKSLHTYWLMDGNAEVKAFRSVQRGLIKHFGGDPSIVNESRVMRLPGFYHCKKEPILVECVSFHPELRYSQSQLAEILGIKDIVKEEDKGPQDGSTKGLSIAMANCLFLQHCRDNAKDLKESDWYAMVTNLAVFEGGRSYIHDLSSPYPKYYKEETDDKISHFLKSGTKPMTCRIIAEKGFSCPRLESGECPGKSPAAMCYRPVDNDTLVKFIKALPVAYDPLKDMQTASAFIREYLAPTEPMYAQILINDEIREKFNFRRDYMKQLITMHKDIHGHLHSSTEMKRNQSAQEIPTWYEVTETGLRFMPGVLAAYLKDNEKVFYAAEEFHRYKDGVYEKFPKLSAENLVRSYLIKEHAKMTQINDTKDQWRMQISKDTRDLDPNPFAINLRNGIYNILEDTLFEHTPDYLSITQLNARYDKEAKCPRFIQYLHETLPDDQIPLVQEMLGYFLVPVNNAQKCFVLVGEGGAGKSVFLRLIEEMLGKEHVSNVSWQALNDKFKPAELYGKLANIFADLPTKNIDDNGIFKALVGEDFLTVEKKHRDPFSFVSHARLLFSCNNIPKNYGDKSEGFYRRLIIIRYDHAVSADKKDPMLLDKLCLEIDGILQFALEGLRRLMSRNWVFSETERNRIELQKYREDSNSVLAFLRDCCTEDENSEIATMELYAKYKEYCEDAGLKPCAQKTMTQEIRTAYPNAKHGKDKLGKRHTFRGIKVEEDLE